MDKYLDEICGKCGLTFGSHLGVDLSETFPKDSCPQTEGGNDWENGPGTCFEPTGEYKGE